ncbi:type III-E CRISPR-associated RpoE-like sigma factor [Pseudodesulfovibrio sp.]|uniref:type III-E CRISPR-associated RpoE-like sigma factor n=1 Tax=Pseudodesulfovibrio sp. TaxID=2035812 RepID=UPI00262B9AE3|nr:type III-E CRISPR-associated RpoE-like sigma factor [Pseudodesulfovibrio sp.]MDD3311447.1 type III-E CRISPR-associated RpoE-like sigma factor [Pseudodesulfovibrio sp.]
MAHFCIDCLTRSSGCKDCPIAPSGLTEAFGKAVRGIEADIARKYPRFDSQVREDVVADAVAGAIRNFPQYEGRREAKLVSWVKSIYRNKVTDLLRRNYDITLVSYDAGADNRAAVEEREEEPLDGLIAILKEMSGGAKENCARLFLSLHEYFRQGRTQKEMASDMGMKSNSLNQKIKRCREWIRERIGREDF